MTIRALRRSQRKAIESQLSHRMRAAQKCSSIYPLQMYASAPFDLRILRRRLIVSLLLALATACPSAEEKRRVPFYFHASPMGRCPSRTYDVEAISKNIAYLVHTGYKALCIKWPYFNEDWRGDDTIVSWSSDCQGVSQSKMQFECFVEGRNLSFTRCCKDSGPPRKQKAPGSVKCRDTIPVLSSRAFFYLPARRKQRYTEKNAFVISRVLVLVDATVQSNDVLRINRVKQLHAEVRSTHVKVPHDTEKVRAVVESGIRAYLLRFACYHG